MINRLCLFIFFSTTLLATTDYYNEYISISSNLNIRLYTIASFTKDSAKTKMYVDKAGRVVFAYFDISKGLPIYVKANSKAITKIEFDKNVGRGDNISLAIDNKTFTSHLVYTDTKQNIYYANNSGGAFESIHLIIPEIAKPKNLNIVISIFREPIIFVVDRYHKVYVSRSIRYNKEFIIDYIYTNKKIDSLIPIADEKGYKLFIKETDTSDIFFAHRNTNTAFRFIDNQPLAFSVSNYSLLYENQREFSLYYIIKNNQNSLYRMSFINDTFSTTELLFLDKKIKAVKVAEGVNFMPSALFSTDDDFLNFYIDENIYDLSSLGKVSDDFEITKINDNLYAILYYSQTFKELRFAILNFKF